MADVKWIYFYYNGNRLLYVGQTIHLQRRLEEHLREDRRYKFVDTVRFFALPESYTQEQVNIVESLFICYLKPPWNKVRTKCFWLDNKSVKAIYMIADSVMKAKGWSEFVNNHSAIASVRNGVIEWESSE